MTYQSILSVITALLLLKLLEIKRGIFLLYYAWFLESENLDKISKRDYDGLNESLVESYHSQAFCFDARKDYFQTFFSIFNIIKSLFNSLQILGLSKSFLAGWERRKSSLVLLIEDTKHVKNNWRGKYSASKKRGVYKGAWVNGTHTKKKIQSNKGFKKEIVLFLIKLIFKINRTFRKREEFHFTWVFSRREAHICGSLQHLEDFIFESFTWYLPSIYILREISLTKKNLQRIQRQIKDNVLPFTGSSR